MKQLWEGNVRISVENLTDVIWHASVGAMSVTGMVVVLLLACFFVTSFAGAVERIVRTGDGQAADLLNARGRFVNQLVASILGGCLYALAALPLWFFAEGLGWIGRAIDLPGIAAAGMVLGVLIWIPIQIYIHLGLRFVAQAVALEDLAPVEAIRRSWTLVDGHRWQLLIYLIVVNVFAALGILACLVGVFVTGAMKATAINESYLRLITPEAELATWWIDSAGGGATAEAAIDPEPAA